MLMMIWWRWWHGSGMVRLFIFVALHDPTIQQFHLSFVQKVKISGTKFTTKPVEKFHNKASEKKKKENKVKLTIMVSLIEYWFLHYGSIDCINLFLGKQLLPNSKLLLGVQLNFGMTTRMAFQLLMIIPSSLFLSSNL